VVCPLHEPHGFKGLRPVEHSLSDMALRQYPRPDGMGWSQGFADVPANGAMLPLSDMVLWGSH
jgi:hypothetical protein